MQIKKFDSINVVPFIDIMLVLLVIVLTTASFIQTGLIKVDLPSATSQSKPNEKKEIKIAIKQDGKIYFDDIEIKQDNLQVKLLTYSKDTPVNVSCDKNAKFDNFIFVVDILKTNGYENLGIVTKK
jgi:biopolymer transport protein ExbD